MHDGPDDEPEREPWRLQPDEPRRMYRVFEFYLRTRPRSLREAVRLAGAEDAQRPISIPGAVSRAAHAWRWSERAAKYDEAQARLDAAAFEQKRREARARRLAALDRASSLLGKRLEMMDEKDVRKMPPHRVIEALIKTQSAEREELLDTREDRASGRREDEPPLPSIESRVKAPEDE